MTLHSPYPDHLYEINQDKGFKMAPFPRTNFLILLLIGAWLASLCPSSAMESYVEDACSVTRYPNICIRSLASFSNTAKRDPYKWARAGVSVTIQEAKIVSGYVANLKSRTSSNSTKGKDRNWAAVSDCLELFLDALDVLHGSLYVLRKFTRKGFDGSRMQDVITWLSAALTDEDTCLGGFGSRGRQKVKRIVLLQNRVVNVTYMTSNALALVNKLSGTAPPN